MEVHLLLLLIYFLSDGPSVSTSEEEWVFISYVRQKSGRGNMNSDYRTEQQYLQLFEQHTVQVSEVSAKSEQLMKRSIWVHSLLNTTESNSSYLFRTAKYLLAFHGIYIPREVTLRKEKEWNVLQMNCCGWNILRLDFLVDRIFLRWVSENCCLFDNWKRKIDGTEVAVVKDEH